jgi:hypothetical protein
LFLGMTTIDANAIIKHSERNLRVGVGLKFGMEN